MRRRFKFKHLLIFCAVIGVVGALLTGVWSLVFAGATIFAAAVCVWLSHAGARKASRNWKWVTLVLATAEVAVAAAFDSLWAIIVAVVILLSCYVLQSTVRSDGSLRPGVDAVRGPSFAIASTFVRMALAVRARDVERYKAAYLEFCSDGWDDRRTALLFSILMTTSMGPEVSGGPVGTKAAPALSAMSWMEMVMWLSERVPELAELVDSADQDLLEKALAPLAEGSPDEWSMAAASALGAAAAAAYFDSFAGDIPDSQFATAKVAEKLAKTFEQTEVVMGALRQAISDGSLRLGPGFAGPARDNTEK